MPVFCLSGGIDDADDFWPKDVAVGAIVTTWDLAGADTFDDDVTEATESDCFWTGRILVHNAQREGERKINENNTSTHNSWHMDKCEMKMKLKQLQAIGNGNQIENWKEDQDQAETEREINGELNVNRGV